MKLLTARAAGVLADTINDANSTRKVYLLAAGLAALGLALVAITVWFWRSTRHDPELLGPLEVLGDRKFRKMEGSEQRQVLEESRPNDVKPLHWGVERGAVDDDPVVTASAFDAALVVADDAGVEPAAVAPDGDAPVDPHSDLDTILAAAGAIVPGRPASTAAASSNGAPAKPTDDAPAVGQSAAGAVAAAGDGSVATSANAGEAKSAATGVDAKSAAIVPASEPAVVPLLIVPVDHDLRPSLSRSVDPVAARDPAGEPVDRVVADHDDLEVLDDGDDLDDGADVDFSDLDNAAGSADVDFDDAHDELAGSGEFDAEDADRGVDATASIDPLLRMFNRNDT
jgi:hypothetical protein